MQISINSLVIEVTRRCNIKCRHCLRGRPQNINIKEAYLDSLFSKVEYVSCLTISGGEPSIAFNSINKIIDSAIAHRVRIDNFYIATNGKRITYPFVKAVERLYNYCGDNDISCVHISNDIYHENCEDTDAFNYLLTFPFVGYKWNKNGYDSLSFDRSGRYYYKNGGIVNSGFAKENGIGSKKDSHNEIQIEIDDENEMFNIVEGDIYLNCKGNIILGCDYSYEDQDNCFEYEPFICHVDDFSTKTLKHFYDNQEIKIQLIKEKKERYEEYERLAIGGIPF